MAVNPKEGSFNRLFVMGPAFVAAWVLIGCGPQHRFQQHINYLASDRLEGRGVGSPGIELAAEYIAKEFARAGLEPAGENGSYFQSFPMTLHRTQTEAARFEFTGDPRRYVQGTDYVPLSVSSDDAFTGELVFCGYGIVAPEKSHDDYLGVDVKGKVALVVLGEPAAWADADGFPTRHEMIRNKIYNAKDRGATAVVVVNPPPPPGGKDVLSEFDADHADEYGIPAVHVLRAVIDAKLATKGLPTLQQVHEAHDARGHGPTQRPLGDLSVSGLAGFQRKTAQTRNVLGRWRGTQSDGEAVVIGAHYDHLGKRKPMSRTFKEGRLVREVVEPQIHNGADDNASGVSGLIEIARQFRDNPRPPRDVLFIAFSGEEAGLHGSKYYVNQPSVPIDKTVAMLNMDMIGRMPEGSTRLQIFGAESAAEFKGLLDAAAQKEGLTIVSSRDEGGRSDHASFTRKQVPALHFFTGHHGDYHKPSDDADRINSEAGTKVARVVYDVARALAGLQHRPAYLAPTQASADAQRGTPTYRVVMGLAPGYVDDGQPGMLVEAVNAEGPADLAGMKAGDRILQISGKKVANVYDYMAATRNNKPGDEIEVVVARAGKEISLKVTLSGTR